MSFEKRKHLLEGQIAVFVHENHFVPGWVEKGLDHRTTANLSDDLGRRSCLDRETSWDFVVNRVLARRTGDERPVAVDKAATRAARWVKRQTVPTNVPNVHGAVLVGA